MVIRWADFRFLAGVVFTWLFIALKIEDDKKYLGVEFTQIEAGKIYTKIKGVAQIRREGDIPR